MKKNLLPGILFTCVIFIFTFCNTPRYIYSPSAHNVPVLTQKGDSKIGVVYSTNVTGEETRDGFTTDNRSRGIDAQGAVAITGNWAIQASHFYRWEKSEGGPDSLQLKYQRNLTELGIGYFMPLNSKKNVFFQFFAGGGIGKFSFSDRDKFGYNFHEANVSKIYLQPAMLFKTQGSFTNAVSVRASIINYRNIKTSYDATQLQDFYLDNLNNRGKVFIEPAYTASFGLKNVPGLRFEFQAGLSFLVARRYVDYRFVNFSAGTWLNMAQLFNKKAE